MIALLARQTESVGDVFTDMLGGGMLDVGALTAAVILLSLGPRRCAGAMRFALRRERGRDPLGPAQLEDLGRTLLLAERTWLALGLLVLVIPWLGNVASIAGVLRGEGQLGSPPGLHGYGLLILIDVIVARLILGGAGRAALARALERGDGVDPTAARTSRVSDALLLAHLAVPPLWFPLMFFRLPG